MLGYKSGGSGGIQMNIHTIAMKNIYSALKHYWGIKE